MNNGADSSTKFLPRFSGLGAEESRGRVPLHRWSRWLGAGFLGPQPSAQEAVAQAVSGAGESPRALACGCSSPRELQSHQKNKDLEKNLHMRATKAEIGEHL